MFAKYDDFWACLEWLNCKNINNNSYNLTIKQAASSFSDHDSAYKLVWIEFGCCSLNTDAHSARVSPEENYLPENGKNAWGSSPSALIEIAMERVRRRERRWYLSSVSPLKQEVAGIRAEQEGMWTMNGCHVTQSSARADRGRGRGGGGGGSRISKPCLHHLSLTSGWQVPSVGRKL